MKVIKTRTIEIFPKATSANTTYYDMEPDDSAYIYKWLYRYLADMAELCTHDEEIKKEFFKRRPGLFPKGKNGPNSFASMLGGICSAKIANPNKDLSESQLDAVSLLFDLISDYYSSEEDPPKSVAFNKKLFVVDK